VASQPDQERSGSPDRGNLDTDLADAFGELFEQMIERFEDIGRRFSLPPFCVKALHMLSSPMAMKELGRRFRCDPSFVTSIADMLDSRGLGRRETDTRDRRIKNLMLTQAGIELRARLERELTAIMPWTSALDASERECLLRLVRKMIKAGHGQTTADPPPTASAPSAGLSSTGSPPASHCVTGGNRAGEVRREPTRAASSGS
jgi:DNA-binding MarR family transcriptional regulator